MLAAPGTAGPFQRRSRRAHAIDDLAGLTGLLCSAAILLRCAAMASDMSLRGKLVRDRIPEIILREGLVPIVETASPQDYDR